MKNKISIYLNMIIICLSICVISIGVYSLTSANLTISGSLGYVYHDKSPYSVTATIQNYTTTKGGSIGSVANLSIQDPTDVTTDSLWQKTKITLPDTMQTIYFDGKGYEAKYIEVLVTVKNNEDTQKAVVLLFDDITGLGYTRKVKESAETTPENITENHSSAIILSKGEQTTFRLTLKQSIKKTNLSIAQDDFNIQLSVANYVASKFTASQTDTTTTTNVTYTLNSTKTAWSITKLVYDTTSVEFAPLISGLPVTTLAEKSFDEMDTLKTMIIPNSLTDNETSSYHWETMSTTITLPGSIVKSGSWGGNMAGRISIISNGIFNFESLGEEAFCHAKGMERLELQSEKLTLISSSYLFKFSSVTEIVIPSNVTSVIGETFDNSSLTTIIFTGKTAPEFGDNIFNHTCTSLTHIYVPSDSVNAYKTALTGLTITYNGSDYVSDLVTAIPDSWDEV